MITALLPMKGHSERIKDKNIRPFNEKPLFLHILETLHNTPQITKIIINTDSEVIATMATEYTKVTIHKRPKELCGDFVSMNNILAYDIAQVNETHFLQTHSTNPLLRSETIEKAVNKYFDNLKIDKDSLFSVTRHQARFYSSEENAINHNPIELIRTQDLPPIYEENSNLYIFSKDSFKKADNKRIGNRPLLFEINKLEAVDIDEHEDFLLAEAIQKLQFTNLTI